MTSKTREETIREAMSSVPVNIKALVEASGLTYRETALTTGSALSITRDGSGKVFLEVNKNDDESQKRVSAAYELARWVLGKHRLGDVKQPHQISGVSPKPYRHESPRMESRGEVDPSTGIRTERLNKFVSQIIMPETVVKMLLVQNKNDVNKTAQALMVNPKAVQITAKRRGWI